MMTLQRDFFGIRDLKELSSRRSAKLLQALEDLLSPNLGTRREAMDRLCEMDAHRRSALAASFLVYRLIEQDLVLRSEIAQAICEAIKPRSTQERSPVKVREYLHSALRGIGKRQVLSLLELISKDPGLLVSVCILLNQCSRSGEILVTVLNCSDYPLPLRIASCEVVARVGFLEAIQPIENLEKRLSDRATGQLSMTFAPSRVEEAKELIPVLQRTLEALREASV
jgi:hypothetical protein